MCKRLKNTKRRYKTTSNKSILRYAHSSVRPKECGNQNILCVVDTREIEQKSISNDLHISMKRGNHLKLVLKMFVVFYSSLLLRLMCVISSANTTSYSATPCGCCSQNNKVNKRTRRWLFVAGQIDVRCDVRVIDFFLFYRAKLLVWSVCVNCFSTVICVTSMYQLIEVSSIRKIITELTKYKMKNDMSRRRSSENVTIDYL